MAERLLKKKGGRKVAPKEGAEFGVVLVGTYKDKQSAYLPSELARACLNIFPLHD